MKRKLEKLTEQSKLDKQEKPTNNKPVTNKPANNKLLTWPGYRSRRPPRSRGA